MIEGQSVAIVLECVGSSDFSASCACLSTATRATAWITMGPAIRWRRSYDLTLTGGTHGLRYSVGPVSTPVRVLVAIGKRRSFHERPDTAETIRRRMRR